MEHLKVLDMRPENAEIMDPIPIVFSQGFNGIPQHLTEVAQRLANERKRQVIFVCDDHGIEHEEKSHRNKTPQRKKGNAIIRMMDEQGIERADVVGYSEGAVTMTDAIMDYPERFRNMVLLNPAGMQGKDNPVALALRAGIEIVQQTWRFIAPVKKEMRQKAMEIMNIDHRYFRDGRLASVREAHNLGHEDIAQRLKFLREEHGMKVGIVAGKRDQLFRKDQTKRNAHKAGIPDELMSFPDFPHIAHVEDPAQVADALAEMFERLEA